MYKTKGFVPHALFTNNQDGVTSKIGEITTFSLTYARDKGYYVKNDIAGLSYISFFSKTDGVVQTVPQSVSDQILTISQYVYNKTINASGQIFADELLNDLTSHFAASAENFNCGEILNDGSYWMPEWLSWHAKGLSGVSADNNIRIWYSDERFRLQYDEYEIVIAPPVDNLNDFFRTGQDVDDMLSGITMAAMATRLQNAKGNCPETIAQIVQYDYVDPHNSSHRVSSPWGVLIYGQAGNNTDACNDALDEYCLANSTHDRADWTVILPDMFKRTEFVLVPRFDKMAIPDRQLTQGVYSPVINMQSAMDELVAFLSGYPEAHIKAYGESLPNPHRSVELLSVGGPDNRDNHFSLLDYFPDYINVTTLDPDFNRMSVLTKGWAQLLQDMILIAESASEFSSIPLGYSRTKRNGKLFVVRNYNNINFLVATKSNYLT